MDDENLLELYLRYAGTSEVPRQYHHWCALMAIAAAVSNRVWLQKGAKRLAPNLYVALIGPSGIGKNEAIDAMLDVLAPCPRVNIFKGKITAPSMLDLLATPARGPVLNSHHTFVTPELSWSMGKGEWADALVKQFTELYTGSTLGIRESTRTSGTRRLQPGEVCINWISGSTQAWLVQAIPPDAISGGFFGRMVVVPAEYNFDVRYPRPILPPDWEALRTALRTRLHVLSCLGGPFEMTPEAAESEVAWYLGRPEPSDPDLAAAWKRQHDFMLKLAMLLTLADGPDLTITAPTLAQAQRLSDHAVSKMPQVLSVSQMTEATRGLPLARAFLARYAGGTVPHRVLLKHLTNKGLDARAIQMAMQTLVEMGEVQSASIGRGRGWQYLGGGVRYPQTQPPHDNGHHADEEEEDE
jgi:hypothetical protein